MRNIWLVVRTFRSWRLGAAGAIATLAIGIGTTTSLYAFVGLVTEDFAGVPELDRVARLYQSNTAIGIERAPISFRDFDSQLSHAAVFQSIGAYTQTDATIGSSTSGSSMEARQVTLGLASPAFFGVMGIPPASGRVFSDEDTKEHRPLVILGDTLWRRQFPDGRITGASLVVDGVR